MLGKGIYDLQALLQVFWDLFAGIKRPPSPRDTIHLFALAGSLREYDRSEANLKLNGKGARARILQPEVAAEPYPISPQHLGEAFRQLFPQEAP